MVLALAVLVVQVLVMVERVRTLAVTLCPMALVVAVVAGAEVTARMALVVQVKQASLLSGTWFKVRVN